MKKTMVIVLALILIGTLAAYKIISSPKPGQKPASPQQQTSLKPKDRQRQPSNKASVSVYYAKPQLIEEKIVATGTVLANKEIELRSEAAGRIVGLYFEEGTYVKKDQLLMKLNDVDLQAQLAKVSAAFNLAVEREKRQKSLYEKQAISQEDYETVQRDLSSSKADVLVIKAQIDKTNLKAPFAGVIGLSTLTIGGYIAVGTKVANLVSLNPLKLEFTIPERFSGTITKHNQLTFSVESSTTLYNAKILAIEPKIDESTRTFKVRAECSNPNANVVPGSYAKVEMIVRQNPSALLIPSESLIPDVQGYKVFIVKDSLVQVRTVTTGIRNERNVEIVKGLQVGDAVVVSGILSIRPGMAVDISSSL